MGFNLDKLTEICIQEIKKFAGKHQDETFYAFAVDANMLCLNSLEGYEKTFNQYRDKWLTRTRQLNSFDEMSEQEKVWDGYYLESAIKYDVEDVNDKDECLKAYNNRRAKERAKGFSYEDPENAERLKSNTGDWEYQGFFDMHDTHGFDYDAYQTHYYKAMESKTGRAPNTKYAKAMDKLIHSLTDSNVFDVLKKTSDFTISWVDHDY